MLYGLRFPVATQPPRASPVRRNAPSAAASRTVPLAVAGTGVDREAHCCDRRRGRRGCCVLVRSCLEFRGFDQPIGGVVREDRWSRLSSECLLPGLPAFGAWLGRTSVFSSHLVAGRRPAWVSWARSSLAQQRLKVKSSACGVAWIPLASWPR